MDRRDSQIIQLLARLPFIHFVVASKCLMALFNLDGQAHSKPTNIHFEIVMLLPDKPPVVFCVDAIESTPAKHKSYERNLVTSLQAFFRGFMTDSNNDAVPLHLLVTTVPLDILASKNKLFAEIDKLRQSCSFCNPGSLSMTPQKYQCIAKCIYNMTRRNIVIVKECSDKLHTFNPPFNMDDPMIQGLLLVGKKDLCPTKDDTSRPRAENCAKFVDCRQKTDKKTKKGCADMWGVDTASSRTAPSRGESIKYTRKLQTDRKTAGSTSSLFHSSHRDLRALDGTRSSGYDTDISDTSEDEVAILKIPPKMQKEREHFQSGVCEHKDTYQCNGWVLYVDYATMTARLQDNSEKREILLSLGHKVSALRNGTGGLICFLITGKDVGDICQEFFNEFVVDTLKDLIQDDDLYPEVYQFRYLPQTSYSQRIYIVELKVKGSTKLCTSDFKTKTRNDCQNERPTLAQLGMFFSNLSEESSDRLSPKIRGIPHDLQELQESRSIEHKSFRPTTYPQDKEQLVNYLWTGLRLKLYVVSMSKIDEGGSVFFGIAEKIIRERSLKTKVLSADGFVVPATKKEVEEQLLKKLKSETVVLNRDGTFTAPPSNLIRIEFHTISEDSGKIVLEVAIRYFCGIVFYDKDGPEAYLDHEGNLERISKEEWFDRFRKSVLKSI